MDLSLIQSELDSFADERDWGQDGIGPRLPCNNRDEPRHSF